MQNCWVLSKTCDLICVLMCYLGIYLGLCPPGEGASKVGQEQYIVQIRKQWHKVQGKKSPECLKNFSLEVSLGKCASKPVSLEI